VAEHEGLHCKSCFIERGDVMGAGAPVQGVSAAVRDASDEELQQAVQNLCKEDLAKVRAALEAVRLGGEKLAQNGEMQDGGEKCNGQGASLSLDGEKRGGDEQPATIQKSPVPAVEAREDKEESKAEDDEIPAEWNWPKEPYNTCYLKQYVLRYTQATKQEQWDEALAARSVGGSFEDHLVEKAFANLLLNKEGTGEEKEGQGHRGIDPNAYKKGKWYRFLNAKGDCNVYIHNYTLDVTSSRPDNNAELSAEEQALLKKLGVYIKELPEHLIKIYDKQKQIPLIFASQGTCEALKVFTQYAKDWQLLDCKDLKRVNAKALEDSRQAIVNAMKLGKWLCIYLGDHIPDLQEKICTTKNRDTFPFAIWNYGGVCADMVKDKIYRDGDKEGGQMVVRDGFRICVVLMYDSMVFEMSSMRKEELPSKIPNFDHMEQVRCYSDDDVDKLLEIHSSSP